MARDTAYFVTAIRQLSNTENDPIVTDPELIDRASEAKAELYDLLIATFEHYAVTTFDFSLVGGVGANSVELPANFYKDVSLTRNPATPETVHRLGSWVDRNSPRRRSYIVMGSDLVVQPPTNAQGDYQLLYTPLDLPFALPVTYTTAYDEVPITRDVGTDAVDGTLQSWFFTNGAFDSSLVDGFLHVTGAANAINNGYHLITAVTDPQTLVTDLDTLASELLGVGVAAATILGPLNSFIPGGVFGAALYFEEADFTGLEAGVATVTIAGSATSDGTYVVGEVTDAHTLQLVGTFADAERFAAGVTVTFQPAGTVNELPQIMAPWYEYIQVHGAIAVKDKIEQDTSDLEVRLERLRQRIEKMAASRMEEGGQVALPSRSSFWGDDTPWG